MQQNRESLNFTHCLHNLNDLFNDVQQDAKASLLRQSETDMERYQRHYEKTYVSSKIVLKPKRFQTQGAPQSNRITPFEEQPRILSQNKQIQTEKKNHIGRQTFLLEKDSFWNERNKNKTEISDYQNSKEQPHSKKSLKQIKKMQNKLCNISKVIINHHFNQVFPQQNCFHGNPLRKKNKYCKFKNIKSQKNSNHQLSPSSQHEEMSKTFTLQIKKMAIPHIRHQSNSFPLKIEDKIGGYIKHSSQKIQLSYNNQCHNIHKLYKIRPQKHRSESTLKAYEQSKSLKQNKQTNSKVDFNSKEFSRFNLINIFKKLNEFKSKEISQYEKRNKIQSEKEKQFNFQDRIYRERYKILKNGIKLNTVHTKDINNTNQITFASNIDRAFNNLQSHQKDCENIKKTQNKTFLSQIYFNEGL